MAPAKKTKKATERRTTGGKSVPSTGGKTVSTAATAPEKKKRRGKAKKDAISTSGRVVSTSGKTLPTTAAKPAANRVGKKKSTTRKRARRTTGQGRPERGDNYDTNKVRDRKHAPVKQWGQAFETMKGHWAIMRQGGIPTAFRAKGAKFRRNRSMFHVWNLQIGIMHRYQNIVQDVSDRLQPKIDQWEALFDLRNIDQLAEDMFKFYNGIEKNAKGVVRGRPAFGAKKIDVMMKPFGYKGKADDEENQEVNNREEHYEAFGHDMSDDDSTTGGVDDNDEEDDEEAAVTGGA